MIDHTIFITLAYLITFTGCGLLVIVTLIRSCRLRKRLQHLSNDQTS